MTAIPVQVECDVHRKAGWVPRRFICETSCIEVDEIQDRWVQSLRDPKRPTADYFKVRSNDGHAYLLRHDRGSGQWFVDGIW